MMRKDCSHACHRCFKDKVLIDLIRSEGKRGWCDWCGGRNVYVTPLHELGEMLRDVASIYQPGDINGDTLSFLLQEDWNIFSDQIEQASDDLMQDLTIAILKAGLSPRDYSTGDYPDFDGYFHRKNEWLVEHWHEKAETYFLGGQRALQDTVPANPNQIAPDDDLPDQLAVAFEDLSYTYEPSRILYRARIHEDRFREKWFSRDEVGAPPPQNTRAGRANRKNKPVLYLAENLKTALAEVRALKGMAVAIARFRVKKQLSVVSLLNYELPESPFFQEFLEWKIQLAALFDRLAEELSLPVLPNENENMYFSTQYLCDWIRQSGYDGIEYPSAMGNGFNVAIFEPECAESLDIQYVRVNQIESKFDCLDEDEPLYDDSPFGYLFMK